MIKKDALEAVSYARAKMVLGKEAKSVFFASLALRLHPVVSENIDTAATDGKHLYVNPEWFQMLSLDEQMGVLAHEVMHCALSHHARRGGREPRKWNIACDLAINQILRDAGYVLPSGALLPNYIPFTTMPIGRTAEEYYNLLRDDIVSAVRGPSIGEVIDGELSREWDAAVSQASCAARSRGELPRGLERAIESIIGSKVDWRDELAEFITKSIISKQDYTWLRGNRRHMWRGVYLPGISGDAIGEIVVAIDTSGSISQKELTVFMRELNGILEAEPVTVYIIYCDMQILKVEQWVPSDGPIVPKRIPGGGGTSHRPIWEWIERNASEPLCAVCFTDGYTYFGMDPGLPVLWAVTQNAKAGPYPFGRKITIEP